MNPNRHGFFTEPHVDLPPSVACLGVVADKLVQATQDVKGICDKADSVTKDIATAAQKLSRLGVHIKQDRDSRWRHERRLESLHSRWFWRTIAAVFLTSVAAAFVGALGAGLLLRSLN